MFRGYRGPLKVLSTELLAQFPSFLDQTTFVRDMTSENPVVNVKQGQLRGAISKNVYDEPYLAFRGVPYAKPPVGPLRFKDPQPPEPWTGVRDAQDFGQSSAQYNFFTRENVGSEDSLYLNVYTPSIEATSKRAVMVWVHGGGFVSGAGDAFFHGPDYLIRKDIVLVAINYRLGVFGFFNVNHEIATGNQGLKDQVMALKWVRENISSFGGDPGNVTIFGESAGSASIHYLTISPLAEGLFDKAIGQSGVAVNPWAMISDEPKKYAFKLAASLGKETTDLEEVVQFLQSVDAMQLLTATNKLSPSDQHHLIFAPFLPTVDDKSPRPFLPQHPSVLMKKGVKVPFLLGFNTTEGSIFTSPMLMPAFQEQNVDGVFQRINSNYESLIHPELREVLKKEGISALDVKRMYFGDQPITKDRLQEYVNLMSDMMFNRGIFEVVKVQMETNASVTYFYKFTYDDRDHPFKKVGLGADVPGTGHAEDILYLFHPKMLEALGVEPIKPGTVEHKISEYFTQMWTDFAKTGNPTPMTTDLISTIWKPVEKGDVFTYLNINETLKMETTKTEEHTFDWRRMKNKL